MSGYVGVDLGATNVGAVVGDADGRVLGRSALATPHSDAGAIVGAIEDAVQTACEEADVRPRDTLAAGIGSVGPLDTARGVSVNPPNLDVAEVPLVEPLVALLEADVYLHNDAAAGAIGERYFGPDDVENLLFCTISTGVGAGAIVDGTVLEGASGNAAEVGHFVLEPTGSRPCGCGGTGHWEAYCSGRNLPKVAREIHEREGIDTGLSLDAIDAADVYAAAGSDPLASAVVERAGRHNAVGVANAIHAFDPAVVAIGGGVALNNPETVVGAIEDHLPALALPSVPEIRTASAGEDAVVVGALASALTGGTGASDGPAGD